MSELSETIAITGSIGSGKSAVSTFLKKKIPVLNLDELNASLLEPGQPGARIFGSLDPDLIDEKGRLDKKKTAARMFGDERFKKEAEALLHPLLLENMKAWIEDQQGFCAVEIPLLFESGWDSLFKRVWLVDAPAQLRLQRLMKQRNMEKEDALSRMAAQLPDEIKRQKASLVLDNSGDLSSLQAQADLALQSLIHKAP